MTSGPAIGPDGLPRTPWALGSEMMLRYYDTEWGMPIRAEHGLFERLSLEGFQAGLSWSTILVKRENFRAAFAGFDPEVVADYAEEDILRLLDDAGIIRHRGKITATIGNARATLALRDRGGLSALIWSYKPEQTPVPQTMEQVPTRSAESEALARRLKAEGFRFVGPTTAFALMEAIGMVDTHLVGSHRRGASGIAFTNQRG
ncbi:DNA-3-methyladenine glycosylase I [Nesterenkonia sp. LB17]|uniref:DNA-3-methyladenine glycosylase I n=1 Tax=unclassified Nesterenkonia TaxID=2629769 RepID=UPI001F4CE5A3|nr:MULTISPECIES: DNA-3-methyladenine glycosylase I [unclassified Nesterenkonia]MCH8561957.1 DNA-3-methyladenine glycosylase I [Nesterenkonia sp. YGD6]MCH8564506.1 DNA-3-methyladenine glycosylase I [Nesterenkonia sp. LB17]